MAEHGNDNHNAGLRPSIISRMTQLFNQIGTAPFFARFRPSPNPASRRRLPATEDELARRQRRRRIFWRGTWIIASVLIVGGTMYVFDIPWSYFEAPVVLDSQLSSRSLVRNTMSVFLPSYIVSYAANPLSAFIDSLFILPPFPHTFHRTVITRLRFLWSHFLRLSPGMKSVAMCLVHFLGVATVNQFFFLGWRATSYLLSLLQDFISFAIHYFFPPPPPPAHSFYGTVTFHGPVIFCSSCEYRRDRNEPRAGQ